MEKEFIIKAYAKVDLAMLYCPDRPADLAMRNFLRWMHKCTPLMGALVEAGYNKHRHSFLKKEVEIIWKHLGEP